MYALIVTQVYETNLCPEYEVFPGDRDDLCAIAAVGTKEELELLVADWPLESETFTSAGRTIVINFRTMSDGKLVQSRIVKVGKL